MDEEEILEQRYQIRLYLDHARQALAAAALNLEHGFYSTAINRAYYAVFYAATGLLRTRGMTRARHSGVIAAFRQHFVAPGLVEAEYSDLYGDIMDARIDSDYEVTLQADEGTAQGRVNDARRFVDRVVPVGCGRDSAMNGPGGLSRREQEAVDVFVQRLYDRYGDRVRSAVLFGSKARGDAGPESDIDLLVTLGDDDPQLRSSVRRLAARVSLEYELLLSVRAVSRSQWDQLSRYRFPLYRSIVSEGIDISH